MSRVVVHAFCGDPTKDGDRPDGKKIVKPNTCFCNDFFAFDTSEGGDTKECGGQDVPNYAGNTLSAQRVNEQLFKVLYGSEKKPDRWCLEFEDKNCIDDAATSDWKSPSEEATVVGHFVAAIIGPDACLDASNADEGDWHEGTALQEIDLDSVSGELKESFVRGCRIDYNKVWTWKKGD